MDDAESLLLVGRVWRPHGVTGDVKIVPETDDPSRFEDLDEVFIGLKAEDAASRRVESIRFQPTKRGLIVIMRLKGIEAREDAEALRGNRVFAREIDLPPLEEDEFYIHELVGLSVVTSGGEHVGTVDDVLSAPAQQVLVISRQGRNSAMVPIVAEFVDEIDFDGGRIVVRPIEGMLD